MLWRRGEVDVLRGRRANTGLGIDIGKGFVAMELRKRWKYGGARRRRRGKLISVLFRHLSMYEQMKFNKLNDNDILKTNDATRLRNDAAL